MEQPGAHFMYIHLALQERCVLEYSPTPVHDRVMHARAWNYLNKSFPVPTKNMSCVCHKPSELSFNESGLIFGLQALLLRHLRALLEPIQPLSQLNSAPSSRDSVQRCPGSAYMPASGSHQWVTRVCCETLRPRTSPMFCLGPGLCAART